ncbi:MAG: ATP-binding protein [Methylococcaceae bacterium]
MINSVELKNFGPIEQLDWQNLGKINLIIGNNGCGKSFILKGLYSAVKTIEEYKRGDNPDSIDEILRRKLYWTFQSEKISHLVNLSSNNDLLFNLAFNQKKFSYSFNKDSSKTQNFNEVSAYEIEPRSDNSIFLPAKEVLSLYHLILNFREQKQLFGFDDTYLDLAKALNQPALLPRELAIEFVECLHNDYELAVINSRKILESIVDGIIEFDDIKKRWYFRKGEQRFPMGVTAEGIKKIAILDTLLSNNYLSKDSIIFIDEPESNLHPTAISQLLDIIALLAEHGMQFFLASHSYFVIKKLFLIAQEKQISIPVLSYQDNEWVQTDLKDDMPSNPIISESIRLFKEEMFLASR